MSADVVRPATTVAVPAGSRGTVRVLPGPRLLSGLEPDEPACGPWLALAGHRARWPEPPALRAPALLETLGHVGVRGRGGAGFPFARKLAAAVEAGRRRHVVVNAAEGEPASAKDGALLLTNPDLVLDGAEAVASALRVRTVHVVVPGERPEVEAAVRQAVSVRDGRVGYAVHRTSGGFVGGQARAVLELIEGRPNLPVTAWAPEAVSGLSGRPTLLANAETFAQVAVVLALGAAGYARAGTPEEPGTTLLTLAGDTADALVVEVEHGTRLPEVLALGGYDAGRPVLVGGYHGAWLPGREVLRRRVLAADLRDAGASLGAGVLLPLTPGTCPVAVTAAVVDYLAGQSAGRCGPCRNGLPALARATSLLSTGGFVSATRRVEEVAGVVTGRGACAHPDGTVRLVRSLLATFPGEVRAHENGRCAVAQGEEPA